MRAVLLCVLLAVAAAHKAHHHKQAKKAREDPPTTHTAAPAQQNSTTRAGPTTISQASNDEAINGTVTAANKTAADDSFGVGAPCPVGFWWDGHRCQDDDECKAHAYVCPAGSKCINTKGSFLCDCGPQHEYRHGECRNARENARNKDVCFLEFPLQFLDFGKDQEKSSQKIFGHQAFNPGLVPKGNTGIAACKESCRNDVRCEAAVVQEDVDDEKHNKCFHRLLRTDEGRPPTNSVLQNLREDHDAVTYVKAKCGSCCEYPDQELKGEPMLSVTALNAQDCCSTAGLVVGAVAAVYQSKDTAYDPKRNCRIFGKLPGYGPHPKAGGKHLPADPLDHLVAKKGSTTLLPGACREAYKYYKTAGADCCLSYKRSYLRSARNSDGSSSESEQPVLAEIRRTAQAMPVDPKRFPLLTSRRDCCDYCKEHGDQCTGAQLIDGYCTLLMNPIVKDDEELALTVGSAVNPDHFAEAFLDSNSKDDSEIRPDIPEESELLIRSQTACDDLFCLYRQVRPRDDSSEGSESFDDIQSEEILRRCWSECQERDDCHAVDLNETFGKDSNGDFSVDEPGTRCNFYSQRDPIGYRPLEVEEDGGLFTQRFVALFKPNPDQTCTPVLEPEETNDRDRRSRRKKTTPP